MKQNLTALKARASVVALFEKDGHALTRFEGHFICDCPFHGDKGSHCHVWPERFHCYECQAHGDAIGYLQKTRTLPVKEAWMILSGK